MLKRIALRWVGLTLLSFAIADTLGAFEFGEAVAVDGEIRGPAAGHQHNPDIAWNGSVYLVVWDDHRNDKGDIYGARVAPDGTILDPSGFVICRKPGEQRHPAIASNMTTGEWMVVWEEVDGGVSYNRLDAEGQALDGSGKVLADAGDDVEVAASVDSFAVAWLSSRRILGCVFEDGAPGEIREIASGWVDEPAIESDGESFLVFWSLVQSGGNGGDIYSRRLNATSLGTAHLLGKGYGTPPRPKAAYSNGKYLVTWPSGSRFEDSLDLIGRLVDIDGSPLRPEQCLSNENEGFGDSNYSGAVSATTNGYAVVWGHERYDQESQATQFLLTGTTCYVTPSGYLATYGNINLSESSLRRQDPELCQGSEPGELLLVWEKHGSSSRGEHENVFGQVLSSSSGLDPVTPEIPISGVSDQLKLDPSTAISTASSRSLDRTIMAIRTDSGTESSMAAGVYVGEISDGLASFPDTLQYLGPSSRKSAPVVAAAANAVACGYFDERGWAKIWVATESGRTTSTRLPGYPVTESRIAVAIGDGEIATIHAAASSQGELGADILFTTIQSELAEAELGTIRLPFAGDQINPLLINRHGLLYLFFEQLQTQSELADLRLVRLQKNPLGNGGFALLDAEPIVLTTGIIRGSSAATGGSVDVMATFRKNNDLRWAAVTPAGQVTGAGQIPPSGNAVASRVLGYSDGANFYFIWEDFQPGSSESAVWIANVASPSLLGRGVIAQSERLRNRSSLRVGTAVQTGAASWQILNLVPNEPPSTTVTIGSSQALFDTTPLSLVLSTEGDDLLLRLTGRRRTSYRIESSYDLITWEPLADIVTTEVQPLENAEYAIEVNASATPRRYFRAVLGTGGL